MVFWFSIVVLCANRKQAPLTWMRATQTGLYSTGKGSGSGSGSGFGDDDFGDDDLLDALMTGGVESGYAVATPIEPMAAPPKLSELPRIVPDVPLDPPFTPDIPVTPAVYPGTPESFLGIPDTYDTPAPVDIDPEIAFVPKPVDIKRRLLSLCKSSHLACGTFNHGNAIEASADVILTRTFLSLLTCSENH